MTCVYSDLPCYMQILWPTICLLQTRTLACFLSLLMICFLSQDVAFVMTHLWMTIEKLFSIWSFLATNMLIILSNKTQLNAVECKLQSVWYYFIRQNKHHLVCLNNSYTGKQLCLEKLCVRLVSYQLRGLFITFFSESVEIACMNL